MRELEREAIAWRWSASHSCAQQPYILWRMHLCHIWAADLLQCLFRLFTGRRKCLQLSIIFCTCTFPNPLSASHRSTMLKKRKRWAIDWAVFQQLWIVTFKVDSLYYQVNCSELPRSGNPLKIISPRKVFIAILRMYFFKNKNTCGSHKTAAKAASVLIFPSEAAAHNSQSLVEQLLFTLILPGSGFCDGCWLDMKCIKILRPVENAFFWRSAWWMSSISGLICELLRCCARL